MPSGRTHDRITLWSVPWIALGSLLLVQRSDLVLIISAAYLFSGLMFGPDLDIHSVQFKRWGCLRWLWLPYQKMLRHRSIFSHGFLLGTILRLLYLGIIALMIGIFGVAIAQLFLDFPWNWRQFLVEVHQQWQAQHWDEGLAAFGGLEAGAMSHSLSDWLGSWRQQARKPRVNTWLPLKLTGKPRSKKRPRRR